jgi:antitoxin HicB
MTDEPYIVGTRGLEMSHVYKIPLTLELQPEGGYTVTSPLLPELITEGDTLDEALDHVRDALQAVLELYEDVGKPLPAILQQEGNTDVLSVEYPISVA